MFNWYNFVKSQPNFIIFGLEEDILNKLMSTVFCDWHYFVVCQRNSRANFIWRQHRKRTILFLQGSVGTRNGCCGQYMHCFVGNLFRCKSAKNYKIRLRCHNLTSSVEMCSFMGHPVHRVSQENVARVVADAGRFLGQSRCRHFMRQSTQRKSSLVLHQVRCAHS